MKPYEYSYKILSSDTDMYRRLRISRLFTFLQEAAIAHTEQLGFGREKTLDRGLLWAITLQQARIERLPVYDDVIRIRTLPGSMMHAFFPRYYQITGADGSTLITASALWILMDEKTRKMVSPKDAGVLIDGAEPDWETFFPAGPALPKNSTELEFAVPYSSIDLNGHMNNTRYFDLALDLLPEDLRRKDLREIRSEYSGEAKAGDTLLLRYEAAPAQFLLTGEKQKRLFRLGLTFR